MTEHLNLTKDEKSTLSRDKPFHTSSPYSRPLFQIQHQGVQRPLRNDLKLCRMGHCWTKLYIHSHDRK